VVAGDQAALDPGGPLAGRDRPGDLAARSGMYCPVRGSRLRASSRLTVDGERPGRAAITRPESPAPRSRAIS